MTRRNLISGAYGRLGLIASLLFVAVLGCKSSPSPELDGGVDSGVDSGADSSADSEGPDGDAEIGGDAGPGDSGADVDSNIDAGPGGDMLVDLVEFHGLPPVGGTITVGDRTIPIEGGRVLLEGFPAGPLRGIVRVPGFVHANVFGTIAPGATTRAVATLMPYGITVEFPADERVELRHQSVGVVLEANSFVDEEGNPATGLITAHVTAFDATRDLAAAPGPFRGIDDAGEEQLMESFGMGDFSFESEGRPLQLADGVSALIDIRVPAELAVPGEFVVIPAWHYDLNAGRWVQEGTGMIQGLGEQTRWVADVSHFSMWNVDKSVRDKECIIVQVNSSENVGVPVYTEGRDYNGVDASRTDSFGETCVEYKAGAQARLRAGSSAYGFSYALDVAGSGETGECDLPGNPGSGSCTTIVIDLPPRTCARGQITIFDAPVAGVRVNMWSGTDDVSLSYTNADGTFCSSAPVGSTVRVYASYVEPITGLFYALDRTIVVGDEEGQCAMGACTDMGTLSLDLDEQYCVDGTAQYRVLGALEDVPVGTPLYAFRASTFLGVNCETQPDVWGAIIGRGTVGAGGDYCMNLPHSDLNRDVIFAADGCDRMTSHCQSDLPESFCYSPDPFTLSGFDLVSIGALCEAARVECEANSIVFE